MLGKLLKYDFRESGRLIFPVLICVILISCFGKFLLITDIFEAMPEYIQFLSIGAYIFFIFICFTGVPICLVVQFYSHFYSNKGYITHTLPVSTGQKLASRIITAYFFELLTCLACIGSIILLLYDHDFYSEIIQALPSADTQFRGMIGMGLYSFLGLNVFVLLAGLLSKQLILFASVSLGQLFQNHRILGSIAAYIIINTVNQIFSFLTMILLSLGDVESMAVPSRTVLVSYYGINIGFMLLMIMACCFICFHFMDKHLNMN